MSFFKHAGVNCSLFMHMEKLCVSPLQRMTTSCSTIHEIKNWISLYSNEPYAHHETCPGTARPPRTDKYNDCVGEVLQIIKR